MRLCGFESRFEHRNPVKQMFCRIFCVHNGTEYYQDAIKIRTDETIANIAIILIRQTDYLIKRYFESIKKDFLENGGIKEEMTRGILQCRNSH